MTERTKAIEDFAGIAERLKEIRKERLPVPEFEPGHSQTPPPPIERPTYDYYDCGAPSGHHAVDPVTGHITWEKD